MRHQRNLERYAGILICVFGSGSVGSSVAQQNAEQPETVMVTLRAKPGAEADLERVVARHWTTAREMKLVSLTEPVQQLDLTARLDYSFQLLGDFSFPLLLAAVQLPNLGHDILAVGIQTFQRHRIYIGLLQHLLLGLRSIGFDLALGFL